MPWGVNLFLGIIFALLALVCVPAICDQIVSQFGDVSPGSLYSQNSLHLPGNINVLSAREFQAALRAHRAEIRHVRAESGGGDPIAATDIGRAIRDASLRVTVPKHGLCASSCVKVLIESNSWSIEADGYLLFHAGRRSAADNANGCAFCRYASIPITWLIARLPSSDIREEMAPWAAQISPNLLEFLKSCTDNPLHSHQGIALSGQQVAMIASSPEALNCSSVRHQDANWYLMNIFPQARHPAS